MRLTTLKSSLQRLPGSKLATLGNAQGVERKSGRAGVADRMEIRQRDCGICQECKRQGRVTLGDEVDHIVPLWQGGGDTPENKQLLCMQCHTSKTAKEAGQRLTGGRAG